MKLFKYKRILYVLFFLIISPEIAYSYLGLGPLIPLMGNAIVFFFIALAAIFGFLAYPIKKIIEKKKRKKINNKKNRNN